TDRTACQTLDRMPMPADEFLDLLDLVDAGDFAVSKRGNFGIEGEVFVTGDAARSLGEWNIAAKSTLVDNGIEDEKRLFRRRQRRQCAVHQALHRDVALAVIMEALGLSFGGLVPTNEIRRVLLWTGRRRRQPP